MTYGTGFETPETPEYAEDDAPRHRPQRMHHPPATSGGPTRAVRRRVLLHLLPRAEDQGRQLGSEQGTIQGGKVISAGPIQFDDGEILEGVSITRAEAQALIEYHYGASKMRIDRAAFDPDKVDAALDAIRGHFKRAENLRQALYPNSPARPVAAPVPEPPPQRQPQPQVITRTLPNIPDAPPPVEIPPSFAPESEVPQEVICRIDGCQTPAIDDDGYCVYHDPYTRIE